ncbi:MAG: cation diffusion facilitator family transporter [Bacteroidales bacterium]|nr:cation diffusion facilitator family transporter [Bacteroidales bacterium]
MTQTATDNDATVRIARHVTWVGFWCNAVLGAAKVAAGVIGRSGAMVADGIHSFSDFVTDFIVLVSVTLGRRKANRRYEYGHGKYETMGTLLVAVALVAVGIFLFVEGLEKVIATLHGEDLPKPRMIALWAGLVSIAVKEWLYQYTVRAGRRIGSQVVIANAWHHRSDSLSSIATVLGVAGAMFLGEGCRILDPIAEMLVSVFIAIVGIRTARPALLELLEVSLSHAEEITIREAIASTEGVKAYHHLRTRRNGPMAIVDVHIKVDPYLPVIEAHSIATRVERAISRSLAQQTLVTTHIEPYNGEEPGPDGSVSD